VERQEAPELQPGYGEPERHEQQLDGNGRAEGEGRIDARQHAAFDHVNAE
jgi:hypothetical protein